MILQGKISSWKIDENKEGIAVLEINPLSEGHTLIIPKKHLQIDQVPSQLFSLAKKVAKKLKSKLKADDISIQSGTAFGHGIINVIPLYKDKKLERKKAEENKLKELQKKLEKKKRKTKIKGKKAAKKELPKAPVRIP